MADLANEEKPAIAPPVFVFQKDKGQKRSADDSSPEQEDSDREDSYCPPVKRERTSSFSQFPPSQSVTKNNVFMPSSFCQPSTGNSDSEPGLPSQKPKEQQRSVLRPAVLQAPQQKTFSAPGFSSGTNGISLSSESSASYPDASAVNPSIHQINADGDRKDSNAQTESCIVKDISEDLEQGEQKTQQSFVFGQNLEDRVKLEVQNNDEKVGSQGMDAPAQTNYFLQYIGSSLENSTHKTEAATSKFVFGQNMIERVLSPPKAEPNSDSNKENSVLESESKSALLENTPEKTNNISESLVESAAAYTKATAKRCLLEKVEVITGEESESNVLQIQCKLFVFDKVSQSWVERGRGLLRLNDMASTEDGLLQSRLVMRTQGSLRLILNTKLWAQMQIDKASEKSIRITAMDTEDQGVKVFLISASSKDTGQLFAALHHRILALRSHVEQDVELKCPEPVREVAQSNEEDSDDDDVLTPSGANVGAPGDEEEKLPASST
ncbi:RAN binding protein 3 L homeolog isoform X1 [Xenopus laevis]|uniref:Ran-binding protein 3 n=1 Tax=Xenopus laevis TaxID=8355 RepID=A0A8J0U3K7_XENLA|nr:RAN binding protein 3 L homeolog isoform X1 [Xenopus laevis]